METLIDDILLQIFKFARSECVIEIAQTCEKYNQLLNSQPRMHCRCCGQWLVQDFGWCPICGGDRYDKPDKK